MNRQEHHPSSGDAHRDASSRPPRPGGPAGAGLGRPTPTVEAGHDLHGDAAPSWLVDDAQHTPTGARRHLLLVLSLLPWTLVIVWFVRGAPHPDPAPVTSAPTAAVERAPDPLPTDDATYRAGEHGAGGPAPAPPVASTGTEPATDIGAGGGARTAITLADATSLAVMLARDRLGGLGPRLGLFDPPLFGDAYVDHIAVEAVDHPGAGHVVVTLLALVLQSEDGDYTDASLQRVAVPLAVDGTGAQPAGTPWLLPAPELSTEIPPTHEIDDPTLVPEIVIALEAADYREVDVLGVGGTEGWPLVATVDAVAPGQVERARHVLWLRPHGNAFVLAGHLPRRESAP